MQHLAAHPARRLARRPRAHPPGLAADLIVFDADRVGDRSTYADGRQPAEGVDHVLVNGGSCWWTAEDRGAAGPPLGRRA